MPKMKSEGGTTSARVEGYGTAVLVWRSPGMLNIVGDDRPNAEVVLPGQLYAARPKVRVSMGHCGDPQLPWKLGATFEFRTTDELVEFCWRVGDALVSTAMKMRQAIADEQEVDLIRQTKAERVALECEGEVQG